MATKIVTAAKITTAVKATVPQPSAPVDTVPQPAATVDTVLKPAATVNTVLPLPAAMVASATSVTEAQADTVPQPAPPVDTEAQADTVPPPAPAMVVTPLTVNTRDQSLPTLTELTATTVLNSSTAAHPTMVDMVMPGEHSMNSYKSSRLVPADSFLCAINSSLIIDFTSIYMQISITIFINSNIFIIYIIISNN